MIRLERQGLAIAGTIALATLTHPSSAAACGGFFCSGPSACTGLFCTTAPTQQSGENLVFSIEDDGTLNVHIQIAYQGESDVFAWILPLPNVPDRIGVGTDDLFTQLDAQTRPVFQIDQRVDGECRATPTCGPVDAGPVFADAAASFADAAGPGPMIHLREEVGPYDAVVLSGTSTDEIVTWLRDNSFDIPTAAEPLIGDYVAARHVFVAIRLLSGRSAGEIQPLTLHYPEGQPCVPIRMTAIAATPDMPITAYFLADARVVPDTYSLLEPTFDDPRVWTGDITYAEYVSGLVDDMGGHAFTTDFAGAVPTVFLTTRGEVDDLATETDPAEFLRSLTMRGYMNDAQLLAILPRFLPVPDGMTAQAYYQCLSQPIGIPPETCGYPGTGFDPAGLVAAIEDQIRRPRQEAQEMLARHPRLTRLFTTLSPDEMSLDPTFRVDDGLEPDVSNVHTATLVRECSPAYAFAQAPTHLELPSGRSVPQSAGTPFTTDADYCAAVGLPPPIGPGTDAGRFDGGVMRLPDGAIVPIPPSSGGCSGCSAGGASPRGALALLALGLLLAVARRRDR